MLWLNVRKEKKKKKGTNLSKIYFLSLFSFFSFVGAISRCMAFSFSHQKLLDHVVPSSPGIGNEFIWLSITLEWRIKTHSSEHEFVSPAEIPLVHARSLVGWPAAMGIPYTQKTRTC